MDKALNKGLTRTQKSMKNMIYGMVGLIINLVITFVAKSIFVRLLGSEYNGLNGLFSNILNVLSLAELGFAGAIAYALYKPLSEGDEMSVAAIMNYFAKVYRIIAFIVLAVGLLCLPFLQYLIKEDVSELPFKLSEIRYYFLFFLANTCCSYLLAYKRTIIIADQNSYVVTNIDNTMNIFLNILQIVLLLVTKNYYAFLGIMVAKTLINNIIVQIIADKKYKFLRNYSKEKIPAGLRKSILKNVKAMLMHRIGTVVIVSTTTIVISTFVGIGEAGMYANYIMITANVGMFINLIFSSITASVGNLCVNGSIEDQIQIYKKIEYLCYFLGMFTLTCYIVLFNDFIEIWVGNQYKFNLLIVIAITFQTFVGYMRKAVLTFRDAKGLFYADRYKAIIEAVVGISLSIGLSYVWGVFGVIIGYTIATVFIAIPIETYVLYKRGFNKPILPHFARLAIVTLASTAVCALTYWIASYIKLDNKIGAFVLKFLLAVSMPTAIYFGSTFMTPEFKYFAGILKRISAKTAKAVKSLFHKKAIQASTDDKDSNSNGDE